MTPAENALWRALRESFPKIHWCRQVPLGSYFVDFCCHGAKLIVEVDGGQHAQKTSQAYDASRTRFLEGEGYRVLRFWNHDVTANPDGVLATIGDALPARLAA